MPIPPSSSGRFPGPCGSRRPRRRWTRAGSPSRTSSASRTSRPGTPSGGSSRRGRPTSPTASSGSRASPPTPSRTRWRGRDWPTNLAGDGQFFAIFDDRHHRQLPRLTGGPFRSKTDASEFLERNRELTTEPVKKAVISASMMMLLDPLEGELEGYSREQLLADVVDEVEKDIRQCFAAGAERVSIDFTEGHLANKNDARNPRTGKDMLKPAHGSPDFARDIAMQKISARIEGARLASEALGI